MQLQQLAYFTAVAETRHFTQAAERMRVAQPSLSKQIKSLETELGAPLFSRARGNVTLTPAGEALLPLARRILADADTARREVAELAGLRRGRVRLGATPSLCAGLLADALARFHRDYPGVELRVEEGGSRDLVRDLARGQLDLALIILPLQSSDPALVTQEILSENLVVVSGGDRGRKPFMRIEDLRGRPLVMFRRGYDVREATLAACRQAGFEPRFAVEGGEMDAVLRFVEAGLGIAVVPSMVLENRPGLVGTPLVPGLRRTVALAHRKDVEPTRAAQAFRSTLLSFLSEAAHAGTLAPGIEALVAM
ncbi:MULTISPECIES: LysR family transcriptional regulator [Microbispora]|uniref:LysR family transcriptional regulator n=3 Tax=Microbispora TaxID=2005 RepID=A0ABY3LP87_9ACTN|nr:MULTISPECIES: LysR substrate-binding domain-containing protein [Microbispora]RGA03311.1 LysR family transcriptional regulator [Microbispora triticiradicis]TLP53611.1 LysR family transcriptional regulator [Microbispora fusca]TYB45098.1 LysR family transcriptional regulator [Microbispora tritici]GLW26552.1 LysR family transcriptional regulator [Microbispora amethystogenes]